MENNSKQSLIQVKYFITQSPCSNDMIYIDENYKNYRPAIRCQYCNLDIIMNEIVYYCNCGKLLHPNCLRTKRTCEECSTNFKLGSYDNDSDKNNSTVDTNINNLENYSEIYNMAVHLSHEGLIERVNKESNVTFDEGRVALSPIDMSNTPYSGKTKSGQKVGDYFKMQSKK
jgi:hypothetical protein